MIAGAWFRAVASTGAPRWGARRLVRLRRSWAWPDVTSQEYHPEIWRRPVGVQNADQRTGDRLPPRHLTRAASATVTVLAIASCSTATVTPQSAPVAGADLGVEHVHGLGVDPTDGVLYAATHFGLWRIPEGEEAVRVADRYQDTMGFTVVGPGTFLASGHPDFQKDPHLPTRLGLIRSTDAGETWNSVSLGGEADFHVLHAVHGRVYGWDSGSGRVLVSGDDGATWETRGVLDLRDLAVSPANPDELLATTQEGLMRSVDGGRTWAQSAGAPILSVLAWPGDDSLYGAAPDGTVLHSADGGTTWLQRGAAAGEPEAMTVRPVGGVETVYVAAAGRGILTSTDGGATFMVRFAE